MAARPIFLENSNAPFYQRAAGDVTGLVSDVPFIALGGLAGAEGGPVGIAAGATAMPMAVRRGLTQLYAQGGGIRSFGDLLNVAKQSLTGAAEGAAIGGATAGVGEAAAPIIGRAISSPLGQIAATRATQIAAVASAPAILQGRLPTMQDFEDAAVTVGGLHIAGEIAPRLMNVYAATGKTPDDVLADAQANPAIADALKTSDTLPAQYQSLADSEAAKAAIPDPLQFGKPEQAEAFTNAPFAATVQEPGEPALPTRINVSYLNTPESFDLAEARLGDLYEPEINAMRGTVSWEQSAAQANKLLIDTFGPKAVNTDGTLPGIDQAPQTPGQLAARMLARRSMAVQAISDAKDLAIRNNAAIDNGTINDAMRAELVMATQRAAMLKAHFLGERAEVARSMSILKSPALMSGKASDAIDATINSVGTTARADDIARALTAADSPSAALDAATKAVTPTFWDKANEVWRAAMLSGPHTAIAKGTGDAINLPVQMAERGIAAGLGLLHGGDKVTLAEAASMPVGLIRGARDAFKVFGTAFRNPDAASPFEHRTQAIGGTLGKIVRFPYRAFSAETEGTRVLNERMALYALATRQAGADGFRVGTNEFNSRVASLVQSPTPEIAEQVKAAGDQGTYTAQLGQYGKLLQTFSHTGIGRWIVPFVKVPVNLSKWAAARIPVVGLMLNDQMADFKAGGARRDLVIARQVLGATAMVTFYYAVNAGVVTGGFQFMTPDQRRTLIASGAQPYSIKLGGTWYSYERFDPLARILSLAADTAEMTHAMADENNKQSWLLMMISLFGHATVSQSYFSGMNSALQALDDPNLSIKTFYQFGGSWVPAVLSQTAEATDPDKRRIDNLFDEVKSRIPGLREELLPQINQLTGEPLASGDNFTPFRTSEQSTNPVLTEAARLGISLAPAPTAVHVGRDTGKLGVDQITPEQQNIFATVQGHTIHELLTPYVTSPEWADTPDMLKARIYEKAMKLARAQGAQAALPPEARQQFFEDISQELEAERSQVTRSNVQ